MRMSRLHAPTLREAPRDAGSPGLAFLQRAGFVHPLAAGLTSFLPLGHRVLRKVVAILREEMEGAGAQEVAMPLVQPAELWRESGRWESAGDEMLRFEDRRGGEHCLAMTHEECVTDLVRGRVRSYKELPLTLFQIQPKFRDEPRARAGLIRGREFLMKDAYSFHADDACLRETYARMARAYFRAFRRMGIEPVAVGSDPGWMGGDEAHEFMALSPLGEDTLLLCSGCDRASNRQVARFRKPPEPACDPEPLREIETPGTTTIEALCELLGIPASGTAKAVFLTADGSDLVMAMVRGDRQLEEAKLAAHLGVAALRPATDEEIRAAGAVPGYAGPLRLDGPCRVVLDDWLVGAPPLVTGANAEGVHLAGFDVTRDLAPPPERIADLTAAEAEDSCMGCGSALAAYRGIEVGNIFRLGTRFSEGMGATFRDADGEDRPFVMGCYGIGPGRCVGTVAELHHDEEGFRWPITVAPYEIHLVSIPGRDADCAAAAEELYDDLRTVGLEVLFDDRKASAGEKFTEADLIGCPLRVTLGARGFRAGTAEIRLRRGDLEEATSLEDLPGRLQELRDELLAEVLSTTASAAPF